MARQADVARFFDRTLDAVKNWAKQGMPGEPGAYDLVAIARWLFTEGPWKPTEFRGPPPEDPLLVGTESPGLERYRVAKAQITEIDLEERRRSLLPRDAVRSALANWAAIIRRAGERVAKRFGAPAAEVLNDALVECGRLVERDFAEPERGGAAIDERAHAPPPAEAANGAARSKRGRKRSQPARTDRSRAEPTPADPNHADDDSTKPAEKTAP